MTAGIFSSLFGDWPVAALMEYLLRMMHTDAHAGAVYLLVGAGQGDIARGRFVISESARQGYRWNGR